MKNYAIISIDPKYCLKTTQVTLFDIQKCHNCQFIPLPCYKSFEEPEKILCKLCYFSVNKNLTNVVIPSNADIELLEKLVFICFHFEKGCQEVFSISNLEDLIFHNQVCLQREEKGDFTKNKRVRQSNNLHENENEKYNKAAINQGLSLQA